jgi:hypothetical protein
MKGGRRSRHRKKLEKGKESAAKDADAEPLFDDNKYAAELLRSAFGKLQGVGEAFDIKAHHDVYKGPTLKGLTFRIRRLAEKLENFFFDDGGSDGDDGRHGNDDGDDGSQGGDGGTPTN